MADYEIQFNVYDGGVGHANVTFIDNGTSTATSLDPLTVGANADRSPKALGRGRVDDGVYRVRPNKGT